METWREWLYPLGFLASIAFTSRFLLQWIASEMKGESHVIKSFWVLSIAGNLMLFTHGWIQLQIHVCLIQGCQALLAWRNLDLMRGEEARATQKGVIIALCAVCAAVILSFALQIGSESFEWFRSPVTPWYHAKKKLGIVWHIVGTLGMVLFSSRFFVQWWHAEKQRASLLNRQFWILSLLGAVLMIVYFAKMRDFVNLIGPCFGLIPYFRNLMLLRQKEAMRPA